MEISKLRNIICACFILATASNTSCQDSVAPGTDRRDLLNYAVIDSANNHVVLIELDRSLRAYSGIVELATQQVIASLCDTFAVEGRTRNMKVYYTDIKRGKRITGPSLTELQLFTVCDEFHRSTDLGNLVVHMFTTYTPGDLITMDKEAHEVLNSFEETNLPYRTNTNSLSGIILPLHSSEIDENTKTLLKQYIRKKTKLLKELLGSSGM